MNDALYHAFTQSMGCYMPFESSPHLAVAVSGGSDSMALCLLAQRWATERGGAITAVTVDHGLRSASADEARQVNRWLKRYGINHVILDWKGEKPTAGIQDAARNARYMLLSQWCRDHDMLHLLLGHQRDDQIETFWQRMIRGSGLYGLSGMATVTERYGVRLLRPLLSQSRKALRDWLEERKQPWLDDPANDDMRYSRSHIRQHRQQWQGELIDDARIAGNISSLGRSRQVHEKQLSAQAVRAFQIYKEGYARIDRERFAVLPQDVALRLLNAIVRIIGAGTAPRMAKTRHLLADISSSTFTGGTLNGCQLQPQGASQEYILLLREPQAIAPAMKLTQGLKRWDNRFLIRCDGLADDDELYVRAMSPAEVAALYHHQDERGVSSKHIPKPVWRTLPAITHLDEVITVPHINHGNLELERLLPDIHVCFAPMQPLLSAPFAAMHHHAA